MTIRKRQTSFIEMIIQNGRDSMDRHDAAFIRELVDYYNRSASRLNGTIGLMEQQIVEAIALHGPDKVTEAWIRRQDWYKTLQANMRAEAAALQDGTADVLNRGRLVAAQQATGTAQHLARAGEVRLANTPALARWAGSIGPMSPLQKVLLGYGRDVYNIMDQAMSDGILRGKNNRAIVAEVQRSLQDKLTPYQASRIVRTETMRTYRGVLNDQLKEFPEGVIIGYRRMAGLDKRTCGTCVAMHNHISPVPHDDYHVMCRCVEVPVFSEDLVEAPAGGYETGAQWLLKQPVEEQKRILGPGRYQEWKDGTALVDMVEYKSNPYWGTTAQFKPLSGSRLPKPDGPQHGTTTMFNGTPVKTPGPAKPAAPPAKPVAPTPANSSSSTGWVPHSQRPGMQPTPPSPKPKRPPVPEYGKATPQDYEDWFRGQGFYAYVDADVDMKAMNRIVNSIDKQMDEGWQMPGFFDFKGKSTDNSFAFATYGHSTPQMRVTYNTKFLQREKGHTLVSDAPIPKPTGRVWTYGGKIESTVYHEFGHIRHYQSINRTGGFSYTRKRGWYFINKEGKKVNKDNWAGWETKKLKATRAKLSEYGQTSPMEYIAEVYSGRKQGLTFDDDVLELYEKLGGVWP